MTSTLSNSARWWAWIAVLGGCSRAPLQDPVDRRAAEEELRRWVEVALGPALLAPPSVDPGPLEARARGVVVRAELVRAEEAAWNAWPDGSARLFNDAGAVLFRVSLDGEPGPEPGPWVRWEPGATTLEVNEAGRSYPALESPERLLEDLLLHGFLEEAWGFPGDLSDRMRAAGPFRAAYLPRAGSDAGAEGVIGFALGEGARDHVVAMRLTLAFRVGDEPGEAQLVFR